MNNEFEKIIVAALKEDMPFGDITSDSIMKSEQITAKLIAKEAGIIAGSNIFTQTMETVNKDTKVDWLVNEGDFVENKTLLATITGDVKDILKAERVALNLMQRACGVATLTSKYVEQLASEKCAILDTRKTTPNLRVLEKYAVTVGGGKNHRFSLSDQAMIKDNHIKAAGSISKAVDMVKKNVSDDILIELECETLEQVKEAIIANVDIIMLDNMDNETMSKAVEMIEGKCITEASGNMTIDRIKEVSKIGVDRISVGALTHSYTSLDISLKF